ncbi:hypothetical protein SAMN05421630_10791 [Prauserella marina]|uniref:Uncharacterized protein n=1 Tax=Prauserella marina TaxID=530584 RepID=A0A1G6TGE4_9PSEU|nr:hypothetical protein DES30_106350 [Prauserella marina]SDD27586.1 hypothetical protein SAMN05421630_10791 [Prauserella marina]
MLGIVTLGLVSGCAGEDLARSNYQRTTITAEPGSSPGEVPTGEITDPAVAASALRTVDPCGLLTEDTLGDVGSTTEDPYASDWGECRASNIKDAGGKTVGISLNLGDSLVTTDNATGGIEGLPLIEDPLDEETCFVTAVTSRGPAAGIATQVTYPGGNACNAGYTVLQKVIQAVRADPPQYEQRAGTALAVDPCASVEESAVSKVLGDGALRSPSGLHACRYQGDSRGPSVSVRMRLGYPPDNKEGTPVDLGRGVKATQQASDSGNSSCKVEWQHLGVSDDEGEIISVSYDDYSDAADVKKSCEGALAMAKGVVPKLPST